VELNDREGAVRESHEEGRHTEMTPIVEQRKEPGRQPAERSNHEYNVEEQKCARAEGANQQRLNSHERMPVKANKDE
jgi:hypothetical protein